MLTKDVVKIFGTQKAIAEAIGVSPSAVYQWGENVPDNRQKSVKLAIESRANSLEKEAASLRASLSEE